MSESARELRSQGWTVLAERRAPETMAHLALALDRLRAASAAPVLYAEEDVVLADDTKISAVGLTFFELLGRAPELAELFVADDLVALLREVLGPTLELEQACGVVSDHTRPLFFWHNHLGGIDGEDFRRPRAATVDRPSIDRLVCTFYATALDDAHGTMLVHPRAMGDALRAPHPPGRHVWPSAIDVAAPAGSVVVLDEATWHAVRPMQREGIRRFAACFVRRAGMPPTRRRDPSIAPAIEADARLRAVYASAPAVDGAPRGRG